MEGLRKKNSHTDSTVKGVKCMDYERFGICLTAIICVSVLGIGAISSGEITIQDYVNLPQTEIETEAEQADDRLDNAYYNWCNKMGIECQ